MLRTIGGDSDSKEEDNIEAIFSKNLNYFYEKLLGADDPLITFELMVIGNSRLPVSDDLYIKMNARGKQLTDFENFKADLISWIKDPKNEDFDNESPDPLTSLREYYPAQIDNKWTDVIWNYSQKNKYGTKIDQIFFSFINRYFLNLVCLKENTTPSNSECLIQKITPSDYEDGDSVVKKDFEMLTGAGNYDGVVSYEGFDIYSRYISSEEIGKIDLLFKMISEYQKIIDEVLSNYDTDLDENNSRYSFLPRLDINNNNKLIPTTQKERVYFLAITLYFVNSKGEFIDEKFKRWMRVAKNLIENAGIDSISSMITCMRLINDIFKKTKENNYDIYDTLANKYIIESPSSMLDYQLIEEIEKAKVIYYGNKLEGEIIEAENFSFFNGTIRFLFLDENGSVNWDLFDKKFKKSKELFKDNNTVSSKTVFALLQYFEQFDDIIDLHLFSTKGYHPRQWNWKKNILCSIEIKDKVHQLLSEGIIPEHHVDYQDFLNSGLIDKILEKEDNYSYRLRYRYGILCIYRERKQGEGVFVSSHRKNMCESFNRYVKTEAISIALPEYNVYCKGYYWGLIVEFIYKENIFEWCNEKETYEFVDNIYLKNNKGEYIKDPICWDGERDLIPILEELLK